MGCLTATGTLARKIELLEGLAFNPDNSSNSARTSTMAVTEEVVAAEKIRRSSAKHR
jgi:hypothetical protein